MQCGQDSDCNPSSVGGILGTYYGFDGIPASCVRNLDEDGTRFSATTLSFRQTVDACYKLMNDSLSEYAVAEEDGYRIAVREIAAVPFEQWPDMPAVEFQAAVRADGSVALRMNAVDKSGVRSIRLDMGDGAVFYDALSSYKYEKAGLYTIALTVTNNNGGVFEKTVEQTGTFPLRPKTEANTAIWHPPATLYAASRRRTARAAATRKAYGTGSSRRPASGRPNSSTIPI